MEGTEGIVLILQLAISIALIWFVADNAGKRGMSAWGWGIFTFFFGVIAWIIFLIARKPRIDQE